jgi:cytochrome c2
MRNSRLTAPAFLSLTVLLCACGADAKKKAAATMTGGDPDRGASSISRYGCGSCHTIPGIVGAHGLVGPPLDGIGNRLYVAGSLQNEPLNMMHWVRDPQSVNEKTVMPNLGVTALDATDIAAYLYSLK